MGHPQKEHYDYFKRGLNWHHHHNIWIHFAIDAYLICKYVCTVRNALVIVLPPFIVASNWRINECHATQSGRLLHLRWPIPYDEFYEKWRKNEGYERFHFHLNSFSSLVSSLWKGVSSHEYHPIQCPYLIIYRWN